MNDDLPVIDVVVLTWNDAEDARAAVASALASPGVEVRVVVVDNGSDVPFASDDASVEVLRSATNLGVGGGRNHGATAGEAPFLCFLDSDAVLEPACLERLVAPMVEEPDVGLTAPVFAGQAIEIGAGRAPSMARKIARGFGLTDTYRAVPHGDGRRWDIDFAIGACQLVRRSAFDAIGGIDDSARFGPEDLDMCLRLGDAGFRRVQVADAVCDHVARRSSRKLLSRRGLDHAKALVRHYWNRRSVGGR